MRISRGFAAVALLALVTGCTGSGEGPSPGTATAAAPATGATTTPVAESAPPSSPPVATKTVVTRSFRASATPTPTKKPATPAAGPAKAQCPITAAKLSSLTKTPFDRIGIGPEEALEEPVGVKAAGCTFASSGAAVSTVVFLTGYGANGEKIWSYVPTTCKGIGGTIVTLGISIKNCTVAGVIRRSVVHRDGSVVWIDFNLPDEGAPALAKTFTGVVDAVGG